MRNLYFGLILIIILSGCTANNSNNVQSISQNELRGTVKLEKNNKSNNAEVVIASTDDKHELIVNIRDKKTGEEKFFTKITDAYLEHYHSKELLKGNLYIIRRIGYDGYSDENWMDELWKYSSNGSSTKLYSAKGLDFRVSSDGKYIAIDDDGTLKLIDVAGNGKAEFSEESIAALEPLADGGTQTLIDWSYRGELWGGLYDEEWPKIFYKVNTSNWQIKTYNVSNLEFHNEFELNVNNGKFVYSDFPAFFDEGPEAIKKFEAEGKTKVNLYLYDLNTKQKEIINTSDSKSFEPRWLDSNKLEYKDPKDGNMKIYIVD